MPAVFVHGVTVRQDRFASLLDTVKGGLQDVRPDFHVEGCYWGDLASSLRYGGASIPGYLEGTRAVAGLAAAAAVDAHEPQLLALLIDDPLVELRMLRDQEAFDPSGAGFTPIPAEVEQRNGLLVAGRDGVEDAVADSVKAVAEHPDRITPDDVKAIVRSSFEEAGRADRSLSVPELIDPLTRSITAGLYQALVEDEEALQGVFRWADAEAAVQSILEEELGGQRGWIGDRLKNVGLGAVTFAMRHGLRRRLMKAMTAFLGDILVYLGNRDTIQERLDERVKAAVKAAGGPLWLVGHSLGGIVSFDYCSRTDRDVDRLVTVGSQVGLFGELGVFGNVPAAPSGKLETPGRVGGWINVYDPDDMLSFLTETVFTSSVDVEFDTRAPFPQSHSEYWNRTELYPVLNGPRGGGG
jgi:hypothetical protein